MKKTIAFFALGMLLLNVSAQKTKTLMPKSVSLVSAGRSANYLSIYHPQQNQLSYNQQIDVLGFFRNGGPSLGNENQVYISLSNDGGTTWDSTTVIYNNPDFPARFPSGALYNPMGNTDVNNLYSIAAGPAMVNDTAYGATFIAWKKRSGTAKNLIINHGNPKRMDFNHFQICTNGKFYFNGYAHSKDGDRYTKWEHTLVSGTLNATNDTVENVTTTTLHPPFAKFGTDTVGSANYSAAVAFNNAGTVGYYVFIGVRGDVPNPETKTGYRPIVYKTLDGGTNWDLQPDFNFAAIPDFNEVLPGIWQDPTDIRPSFSEINDLIVDGNNNLHILSYVYGQYTSNTDSLEKTWDFSNIQGIMYDTYTSATGWHSALIDVQNTKDHIAIDSTDVDIANRLQGGISTDGSIVFYSWADSDPNTVTENILPDLYITGRHIDSAYVFFDKMNVTNNGDLQYGATYHTMAPQVRINGSSQCFYPYLMVSQLGASSSTDPVNYMFMKNSSLYIEEPLNPLIKIVSQSNSNQYICISDSSVSFFVNVDLSGEPISYQWQYLNGTTWQNVSNGTPSGFTYINPTQSNMTVSNVTTNGSYKFRCFLSRCMGASDATSITMNLTRVSEPADSAGAISGPTNVCQGQNATFSVPVIANATSYLWTFPSGIYSTTSTNSNSVTVYCQATANSGNIVVQGKSPCGDGIPAILPIVVDPQPVTPIVTLNGSVLHSSAATGNQWYNQNGIISGATNQDYTVVANGFYHVIVTSINGCSSNPSNYINIAADVVGYDANADLVKIYPNPVSDLLTLEIEGDNQEQNFECINTMGQIIHRGRIFQNCTVNTSGFAEGVYLIKFKDGKSVRFVKSK